MATISVEVPDELAERLMPYQDRLPEILDFGLRQVEDAFDAPAVSTVSTKSRIIAALKATGIVTIPKLDPANLKRPPFTPITVPGKPVSELIIEERRQRYDTDSE